MEKIYQKFQFVAPGLVAGAFVLGILPPYSDPETLLWFWIARGMLLSIGIGAAWYQLRPRPSMIASVLIIAAFVAGNIVRGTPWPNIW